MDRRLGELDTKVDRRLGARGQADERDPQAARRGRPGDRADGRAGEGAQRAAGDPASAQGPRRLRRAAAREPAARPAAGDGVRVPVRLRGRRARRRRDQGRADRPDRLQVPARQLRADAARRQRHRAPAVREGVRPRREGARRRDREQVHPAGRGHLRLRLHVPAVGGDLLRARLRQHRRAARLRAREARAARLADDVDRLPAGDRARAEGAPDRAARARGDGLLRAAAEGLRALQGGLRAGRDAPRPRAEQVPRLREAAGQVRVEARAGGRLRAGARAGRDARASPRGRRCVA